MTERGIDRNRVRELVAAGAQLVEVLGPEDYDDEHLPEAVDIPLRALADGAAGLDPSRPVIVYCYDTQ